jgi:hypothetical protein
MRELPDTGQWALALWRAPYSSRVCLSVVLGGMSCVASDRNARHASSSVWKCRTSIARRSAVIVPMANCLQSWSRANALSLKRAKTVTCVVIPPRPAVASTGAQIYGLSETTAFTRVCSSEVSGILPLTALKQPGHQQR